MSSSLAPNNSRDHDEAVEYHQDNTSTVVFFHPDLGIGGAERLVVDAAVGLQERGHRVVIFTNHCDPGHCFDECRNGTLDVRVRGDWLVPMSIFSRLTILCAILRHLHLLLHIHFSGELAALCPNAVFVDQLSAGLPLLRNLVLGARDAATTTGAGAGAVTGAKTSIPILFYCHFPDLLLVQGRQSSALKRLYRIPFDRIEEWSMGFADAVAVNSNFTKGVVAQTWPRLTSQVDLKVVYPCVDTEAAESQHLKAQTSTANVPSHIAAPNEKILLSINRFERKKDIGLAIKAFAAIPEAERVNVRLVLAGGYDPRVAENVQYHTELQSLASSLNLSHQTINNTASTPVTTPTTATSSCAVLFLLSVPHALKTALLSAATLLIYTPSNEHFGIVPLEAMLARLPVLAANTGGPVETVRDGITGWLRDPNDPRAWSFVMRQALALSSENKLRMGEDGAARVKTLFGREQMALRLDEILDESSRVYKSGRDESVFGFLVAFFTTATMVGVVGTVLAFAGSKSVSIN